MTCREMVLDDLFSRQLIQEGWYLKTLRKIDDLKEEINCWRPLEGLMNSKKNVTVEDP